MLWYFHFEKNLFVEPEKSIRKTEKTWMWQLWHFHSEENVIGRGVIDTDVPTVKCLQNKKWKKIDDRQKMPLPCRGVTGHLKKKFENSTKMESKDFLYVSYLKNRLWGQSASCYSAPVCLSNCSLKLGTWAREGGMEGLFPEPDSWDFSGIRCLSTNHSLLITVNIVVIKHPHLSTVLL